MSKGNSKIRVYEFAKKYGVSSKEVVSAAEKTFPDIKSHMSVLSDKAIGVLAKKFDKTRLDTYSKTDIKKTDGSGQKNPQDNLQNNLKDKEPASKKQVDKWANEQYKKDQNKVSDSGLRKKKEEFSGKKRPFVCESMSISEFSEKTGKSVGEVVLHLIKQGILASKNKVLPEETICEIASFYGLKVVSYKAPEKKFRTEEAQCEASENLAERVPVVVVIGHVNHGKTTLLDYIKKTHVALKEKGGITQQIGAYEIALDQGKLVFLDTPGHEAFKKMREWGTRLADIAILVVAADDGVKPQTVEAIRQARSANLPIFVAINKVDKAGDKQIDSIKAGLAEHDVLVEDLGGSVVCMPISAKLGTGVEDLIDVLVLQSQIMELKAALGVPAFGYIVDSRREKGLGSVATVICKNGILKVGDYFVTGSTKGKVSLLRDFRGEKISESYPSQPVQVTGFDELPDTGDFFQVKPLEEVKKLKFAKKAAKGRHRGFSPSLKPGGFESKIKIFVKADNDLTLEAVIDSLKKINKSSAHAFELVATGVGNITEKDVQLAWDTGATLYGLHTKLGQKAASLASRLQVTVKQFDIIYKLIEVFEELTKGEESKKVQEKETGEAVVIEVFKIKALGKIAGARMASGKVSANSKAIVFRDDKKVGEGAVKSLQMEKESVKAVSSPGTEFAINVKNFSDWMIGDNVKFY